jgi:S-DNA-T family DNA segregation ATPase FtsK/SpoIIIE
MSYLWSIAIETRQFMQESIQNVLQSFGINAECVSFKKNSNYISYDLKLIGKSKIKDITKSLEEISLAIKAPEKGNLKILHSEGIIKLEFRTKQTDSFSFYNYMQRIPVSYIQDMQIPILIGKTVSEQPVILDLAKAPHILIAGTTGSGKSVLLHNIIASLFEYKKIANLDLYLSDPKYIEFKKYNNNSLVVNNLEGTQWLLDSLVKKMENNYHLLASGETIDPSVFIIDEFADLSAQDKSKTFMNQICRLAQKARAAKIHLVLATQRPSVKVISGDVKANFPTKIACRTVNATDSRVILGQAGAERLAGRGDAYLCDDTRDMLRFQACYVSDDEVIKNA